MNDSVKLEYMCQIIRYWAEQDGSSDIDRDILIDLDAVRRGVTPDCINEYYEQETI